jgi:HPr kinase/phosphorylase
MVTSLTVGSLFETQSDRLRLEWVAGRAGATRQIRRPDSQDASFPLVGYLNVIRPQHVQVLGGRELSYIETPPVKHDPIGQLFALGPDVVIVADGQPVPRYFIEHAERTSTPLFASALSSGELIGNLQYFLSHLLAESIVVPGVFMEVVGIGVLLTGKSGVGKSELALELLTRGQRLIADDAPEFSRIAPDVLNGTCPEPLRDFLEVRGIGILNIRAMFGDGAIKPNKYLRLIVHLERMTDQQLRTIDRLCGSQHRRTLLGLEVPVVTLPVAPGRNLAVLVEAAVRNHLLRTRGYHAAEDFIARQQRHLQQEAR